MPLFFYISPCPSQIFVRSEMIDKISHACQSRFMIKTLRNLVLAIWLKTKIISNLATENLALRHQLAVMKRTNKRPKIQVRDRLFWVLLSRIWVPWRKSLVIVKPDTVVHWHRKGFKLFWKFNSKGFHGADPKQANSSLFITTTNRSVIYQLTNMRCITLDPIVHFLY